MPIQRKKQGSTPPAPQNRRKRAEYFIKRMPDPHAKAELLKLSIDQETSDFLRPKQRKF